MNQYTEDYEQEKKWVEAFENEDITDDEIIALIHVLADSGQKFSFDKEVYDFASTGGPSSLSTILVPLYLFACGVNVINIAVSGRPAGAIDVLSQIENYHIHGYDRTKMDDKQFYLHLEADSNFAPLDRKLFEYRRMVNKVNNPRLAIASLLSKKIASGASNIGLDVRAAPIGNFGNSWDECRNNARRYNRIAERLGLVSKCFLCDASMPFQPYIGRGEALVAIHRIMNDEDDKSLLEHNNYCMDIARVMTENKGNSLKNQIKDVFIENLHYQGSSYKLFEEAVARIKEQPYYTYTALESGYIRYDLSAIRSYLVYRQSVDDSSNRYPDPSGIILLCQQNDYVQKGQPVFCVRNSEKQIEDKYVFYMIQSNECERKHESEVI